MDKFNDEETNRIIKQMYLDGAKCSEIASTVFLSREVIYKRLKSMNVTVYDTQSGHRGYFVEACKKAYEEFLKGEQAQVVCKKYGISTQGFREWRHENGLMIRKNGDDFKRTPRKLKITPEEYERMYADYKAGVKTQILERRYGVKMNALRTYMVRTGKQARYPRTRFAATAGGTAHDKKGSSDTPLLPESRPVQTRETLSERMVPR